MFDQYNRDRFLWQSILLPLNYDIFSSAIESRVCHVAAIVGGLTCQNWQHINGLFVCRTVCMQARIQVLLAGVLAPFGPPPAVLDKDIGSLGKDVICGP